MAHGSTPGQPDDVPVVARCVPFTPFGACTAERGWAHVSGQLSTFVQLTNGDALIGRLRTFDAYISRIVNDSTVFVSYKPSSLTRCSPTTRQYRPPIYSHDVTTNLSL